MKPEKKIELRNVAEGALLAAGRPLTLDELLALFPDDDRPDRAEMRKALEALQKDFEGRGIELKEVASGFRVQVKKELASSIGRLWEERPARYSRALLETLALVAYRQPITRGEIEEVRGVTVSTHIIRTLQDRNWIRVVGHRDVPGHPEMFGTTKEFLDYFSLKSLDELPTLAQLRDIESINAELDFGDSAAIPAQVAPETPVAAPRLVPDLAPEQDEDDGEAGVTTH
ncbi:MAG TPA: SMC-Scp complex subunit ScpB [Gammaproteobacteria bacterium]|nr:SMC-Scp complex subunit ScpB [Gammaproteobacteria bacterium]